MTHLLSRLHPIAARMASASLVLALAVPATLSAQEAPSLSGVVIDAADDNRMFTRLGGTARDDITYSGLEPGQAYTLSAQFLDRATSQPAGDPVTMTFTPEAAEGQVSMDLPVAANRTASNQDFTILLRLYADGADPASDAPLAELTDAADENRAIQVHATQQISVTASDKADGDMTLDPAGGVITATVDHVNLVPGYSYTVWGQLLSASGQSTAIYASIPDYVPDQKDGSVTLEFEVPDGFEGVRLIPSVGLYHAKRVSVGPDGMLTFLPDVPNPVMIASDPDVRTPEKTISIGVPFEDQPADD